MFNRKPKSLSLTQSDNYSFVVSFDKISSNSKKIIKIFKLLGGLKTFVW